MLRRVEKNNRPGGLPAPIQAERSKSARYIAGNRPVVKSLPQVWGEFLNQPEFEWSLYGHFTFRDVLGGDGVLRHVHPESAGKTWDVFIHELNRKIFGQRYWKRPTEGVSWARASEYQVRGAIHYHAVIGRVPPEIRRLDLMDKWNARAGYARIYPYEVGRGAEFYLSKSCYAWKKGEIDLGGPMAELKRGLVQQRLRA